MSTVTARRRQSNINWDEPPSVLKGLCAEPLAGLISLAKLYASPHFIELVTYTTERAMQNNFGPALALLRLYGGTAQYHQLKAWYEARAALEVHEADRRQGLRPRKGGTPRLVRLSEYFPEAAAAARARMEREHVARVEEKTGVVSVKEKRVDLMDTRLRLPGSFEGGKRR